MILTLKFITTIFLNYIQSKRIIRYEISKGKVWIFTPTILQRFQRVWTEAKLSIRILVILVKQWQLTFFLFFVITNNGSYLRRQIFGICGPFVFFQVSQRLFLLSFRVVLNPSLVYSPISKNIIVNLKFKHFVLVIKK